MSDDLHKTETSTAELVARADARAGEARDRRQTNRAQRDAESRQQTRYAMDVEHELAQARRTIDQLEQENQTLRDRLATRPRNVRKSSGETSRQAAMLTRQSRDNQLGKLARAFMSEGARRNGLTAFEAAKAANLPGSWRRVSDLRRLGMITDTETVRPNPETGLAMQVDKMPDDVFARLSGQWGWPPI